MAVRERAEVTLWRGTADALARPGLAPCALWRGMGVAWASLGALFPACACVVLTRGWYGRVQESEGRLVDTVVQARIDQVRRWHDMDMPCHGMARFC